MPIRNALPRDRDSVYDICLRTADSGDDGRHLYADPDLPGHIWAGAYLAFEPSLAFVLDDGNGLAGYVIGALDTVAFEDRCEREWWPALRARYPDPESVPAAERTHDEQLCHRIHRPFRTPESIATPYPSHLHIDLLPRAQGRGDGRALLEHFEEALREQGSTGLHFGVSSRNKRALEFYRHLGYDVIDDVGGGVIFGRVL